MQSRAQTSYFIVGRQGRMEIQGDTCRSADPAKHTSEGRGQSTEVLALIPWPGPGKGDPMHGVVGVTGDASATLLLPSTILAVTLASSTPSASPQSRSISPSPT
jgi:hypothetical protein